MNFAATITAEDLDRDPDPILARLREEEPVAWIPALEMWFVTRWEDVQAMEDHPEVFSAATEPSFLARTLGQNMLTQDPPACTRLQRAMKPPFLRAGRSGTFVERELPNLCDLLSEDFREEGAGDITSGYADAVSAGSLAAVLGLDGHGWEEVWGWCEGVCTGVAKLRPGSGAVRGGAARRRRHRGGRARTAGRAPRPPGSFGTPSISCAPSEQLTATEIVNNVRLMISGGINEPRDGIALVVWTLLSDDGLRERALGSAAAMRRLVDEVLRRYTPVGTITRQTTRATELGRSPPPRRSSRLGDPALRQPRSGPLPRSRADHPLPHRGGERRLRARRPPLHRRVAGTTGDPGGRRAALPQPPRTAPRPGA